MKKIMILMTVSLFVFAACKKNEPVGDAPPSVTYIPEIGEVQIVPEDEIEITGEDPVVEFVPGEDDEIELVQNPADLKLTNSFLGISFTVPEGWFFWAADLYNLRADPALTAKESDLSLEKDVNGETYADFFDIGNNEDEYEDDHLSVAARAVKLEGVTFSDYVSRYKEMNLLSENVTLLHEGTFEINGTDYERVILFVYDTYDEYDSRMVDTFFTERNGYAVLIKFEAWASYPENEKMLAAFMQYCVEIID